MENKIKQNNNANRKECGAACATETDIYKTNCKNCIHAPICEYCDLLHIPIVHIPNEGKRSLSYAARMKRMGLRSGFPDLLVPLSRGGYHGLFIEMKYGKNKTTKEQKEWLERLSAEGYACVVCWSSDEAIWLIDAYNKDKGERK